MTLGQRIKQARKAKKLTQEQVGTALGIQRAAVTNWERDEDKPSLDNLLKLTELLEADLNQLVYGHTYPELAARVIRVHQETDEEGKEWLERSVQREEERVRRRRQES